MTYINDFIKTVKKLLLFSNPIIFNSLLNMLPLIISMWALAKLGEEQLAAAAIAVPTFYTIITIFMSGLYAVGIKVGHSFGESNQNNDIGLWMKNGLFLAVLLSLPAILILLNINHLLLMFGQSPRLLKIAKPFFDFGALSVVAMLVNTVLTQYFSAIGRPKIVLILSIITLPLVVLLSFALALGRIGFPQLGLAGINCAVLIVEIIVMISAIAIVKISQYSKPYKIFSRPIGIKYQYWIELIKLGWPISIQVSSELAAMTIATYMLGIFGDTALAASQIVAQYVMVFIMISMGLEQGVTILVSHAYGQKDKVAIAQITNAGILLNLLVSFCFIVPFLFFSKELIYFYLHTNETIEGQFVEFIIEFMKIAAIYIFFDGLRHILTSTLRGLNDTKTPMKIGAVCLILIGLPYSYLGGFILHGGPIKLRLDYTWGVIIATFWLIYRYRLKFKTLTFKDENIQN